MRARSRLIVLLLLAGSTVAGCGGGETPPAVDAKPAEAVTAGAGKPLPPSALQVRWGTLNFPRTVGPDTTVPVTVSVTNIGDTAWPDKASASEKKDGSYAVRVAYAFVQAEDPQRGRVGAQRTDLLRPVLPGESASVPLSIRTPSKPGDYNLRIELIQELVQWFADRGADTITLPVHVGPPGTAPADPASASSGPANAPDRR